MNNNKTNIYYIYYQIVHEVHNRGIKLLTLAKSRSNESDIKPFRTKNNSSTALATATTRGSDLQKTPTNKTVVTRHKTKKKISDVQKPNLLLQNRALFPIGAAMWSTVMP